jgi:hypothetical protein
MLPDDAQLPDSLKALFRNELLEQTKADDCLGLYELSLFEFYLNENETTIQRMLSAELAYVEEQVSHGVKVVNDSGIVAAKYFTRRIRYADVIYLYSLIETFLENACKKLDFILNGPDGCFNAGRGGGKWQRCNKFLLDHGGFGVIGLFEGVLQSARTVRNCIAHDNGHTGDLTEAEKTALLTEAGLTLNDGDIVVDHKFVQNAFDAFKVMVVAVNSELSKLIDSKLRESRRE